MHRFVYMCCILSMLLWPMGVTGKVFAETNVPTVMDGLVNHISDRYPAILNETDEAKKAEISDLILSSIKTNVENIYKQSQKWKNSFVGRLQQNRSQIVDYDHTFDSLYAEIQQQIQEGNKQQVLQLLQTLQNDLREKEKNVSSFITDVEVFKSEMIEYARKLQNDMLPIHSRMEVYRAAIQDLENRLESEPSAKKRDRIAEEMMVPSALLYDILEPLYNHLNFLIQDIYGVNDGRFVIGWQVSLEEILVTWNSLDSMLSSIIDEVNHASQLNKIFMKGRLQAAQDLWKSEIIGKLKM
ncbi:HBL/NHE enterotoxin family protein [Bacillus toyonensis]|uniref:Uncharacterized protein n=1 Tax=Bacillus toyonensis TaxID=155322 RepID=A0A2C4QEX0_9BACI|nr:HBL/NHE enterotoxin family protein [Bacillus toyonensis]PGA91459.1 hypothetical protein COL93_27245 [Bacillus toyonensis]PHD63061.1 hypothetical protein COF40_25795 [Bacillus toyonensis]